MAYTSNAQFDAILEALAELIEKTAKTPQEAAEIVRNFKITKKEADTVRK